MIKEQDYPYFCKPNGREKFERFVRDFKICAPSRLLKAAQYELFRNFRYPGYEDGYAYDHISFWMTDEIRRIYYVVSQPYSNQELAIQALQNDMPLRRAAAKYNYKIHLFNNGRYNWHNDGCIFILFQLNNPEDPFLNNVEVPLLKIETN